MPKADRYDAVFAGLGRGAAIASEGKGFAGNGYVSLAKSGASVEFVASVPARGYYDLTLRYSAGPAQATAGKRKPALSVNGLRVAGIDFPETASWDEWRESKVRLFLAAGINRVVVSKGEGEDTEAARIDCLELLPTSGSVDFYTPEAMPKGLQVKGIKAGKAGTYRMVVFYANADKMGNHQYNVNVIDRSFTLLTTACVHQL